MDSASTSRRVLSPNGDQGFPVVPGDLEASLLYQRITQKNERLRMPPAYSKKQLTQAQVEILKGWIEEGASWDLHWSFQPLGRPELAHSEKRTVGPQSC